MNKDSIDREQRLNESPEKLKAEVSGSSPVALKIAFLKAHPEFAPTPDGLIWGNAIGVAGVHPTGPFPPKAGIVIFSTQPLDNLPQEYKGLSIYNKVEKPPEIQAQ